MNPNRVLALLMGRHWHEGITYPDGTKSRYKCSCMEHQNIEPLSRLNPDSFSNPADIRELQEWLFADEQETLWFVFRYWSVCTWMQSKPPYYDNGEARFEAWLFSRIPSLLIDFLGTEEAQDKFGLVECPHKKEWPRIKPNGESAFFCELECNKQNIQSCNGSGRIMRPWLRALKEE